MEDLLDSNSGVISLSSICGVYALHLHYSVIRSKKKHTHTRGRFIDSFRDFMLPLLNLYNTKLLSPHLNIEMLLVTLFSMSFQ